jgi:caa(3)-type oxidase subunit IV
MSAETQHGDHGSHAHGDHSAHYKKIYWILLALLVVSVVGPFVGDAFHMKAITLLTAFGIALVKAFLVCKHFMHIHLDKKYITFLLVAALMFMGLFYAGVAPDVMEHHGRNWENVAAKQETARALAEQAANPGGHH